MPQKSISRLFTTFAIAATAPLVSTNTNAASSISVEGEIPFVHLYKSGHEMIRFFHAEEMYIKTCDEGKGIDQATVAMQERFQSLKRSFFRYNDGFPEEKRGYFLQLADALCKLSFKDNITSYNRTDESIDTIIKLSNGLTLSVSRFIDDGLDAPVVFSVHRGSILLVSDELPINEVVATLISLAS